MARRQSTSLKRRVVQLVDEGKAEEAYNFLVEKKWVLDGSGYKRHYPTGLELFVEVDETRQILKSKGRSPRYWAWEVAGPYARIPDEEIMATDYGLKAGLMLMANLTLKDAAAQAAGIKVREPQFHEDGWDIAITTPKGVVGLWSCWLGNRFYLGYPKTLQLILDALDESVVRRLAIYYYTNNRSRFAEWYEGPEGYDEAYRLLLGLGDQEFMQLFCTGGFPAVLEWPHFEPIEVPDSLITDTLDVGLAEPVTQVSSWVISPDDPLHDWEDSEKPRTVNKAGQTIAYEHEQGRLWAKFYGPRLEDGGRVWVGHARRHSNSYYFPVITEDGVLENVYYGHDYSTGIWTYKFNFYNEYAPDGPRADEESIQPYRDKFLTLACAIAQRMGGTQHATINYGFCMVPEDLEREGYEQIEWLKGVPGRREGWGADTVRAVKDDEIVILKSGNSLVPWGMVPWGTIRRVPFDGSVEILKGLLTF